MAALNVILILVDRNSNILFIPDATNTTYSFPTIQTIAADRNLGADDNTAAKNAAIRLLSTCSINMTRDTFNIRSSDISITNAAGEKIYLYVLKLDDTERAGIILNPTRLFIHINNMPKALNLLSASVAVTITKYFDLIRYATNPPSLINYIFPIRILPYYPSLIVPVYTPINMSFKNNKLPVSTSAPTIERKSPKKERESPKKQPKPVSPKNQTKPIQIDFPSSKLNKPKIYPIINKKKIGKIKSKKSSKNLSDTSSVSSKSSNGSRGSTGSRGSNSRGSNSRGRRGGYYDKYIKYKIKYLESEKHILYLEEKINKYNSI